MAFGYTAIAKWVRIQAANLSQHSLIYRVLGINDHVKALRHSQPSMFFYNQRAMFFGCSCLVLITISFFAVLFKSDQKVYKTISILCVFWIIAALITLVIHHSFIMRLSALSESITPNKLTSLFGRYFLIDFCLVFFMILFGKIQGLNLDTFAFLLVANTIVYSAYAGGGRGFNLLIPGTLYLLLVLTFLLFPIPTASFISESPRWFNTLIYIGPLASMLGVTVVSVTLISWLRSTEYLTTQRQLELLGRYEEILASVDMKQINAKNLRHYQQFNQREFRNRVKWVLDDLCSHKSLFWYDSACLWFQENHKDRDKLLLPGPSVNFQEAHHYAQGVKAAEGFLSTKELILISSMKYRSSKWQVVTPRFRSDIDAPAAFVPLYRRTKHIGVLALYGKQDGRSAQRQDKAFLKSLGSIISNTLELWEGRFKALPQQEMNELFKCQTLEEVFEQVVIILQKYLMAAGCKVIFRPNAEGKTMRVVAAQGFSNEIYNIEYIVGRGKTGECAEKGLTFRFDYVPKHRNDGFDPEYFEVLEREHGKPIVSWMAIPIGGKGHNHGVIKVVNSIFPYSWFTDDDQELGEDLALRLQVIIEKFLYITQVVTYDRQDRRQVC